MKVARSRLLPISSPVLWIAATGAMALGVLGIAANGTRVRSLAGTWSVTEVTYPQPMSYLMGRSIVPGRLVTIEADGSVHGEYYYLTALIAPRGFGSNAFVIHETASNERYKARLSDPLTLEVVGSNGAYLKLSRRTPLSAPSR